MHPDECVRSVCDGPWPTCIQRWPLTHSSPLVAVGQEHLHVNSFVLAIFGFAQEQDKVTAALVGVWLAADPTSGEKSNFPFAIGVAVVEYVYGQHEHRPNVVRLSHRGPTHSRYQDRRTHWQPETFCQFRSASWSGLP